MKITEKEIVERWKRKIVAHANELDNDADRGGHDWHSLWAGFVTALGRRDLAGWNSYMRLGFYGRVMRHDDT